MGISNVLLFGSISFLLVHVDFSSKALSELLVKQAYKKGSTDNITALIVNLNAEKGAKTTALPQSKL